MSKFLMTNQRSGKIGELVVEQCVYEIGFSYHPSGDLETGIDGFIEICNLETGAALGRFIAVQVKSTSVSKIDYVASTEDVAYWRNQNLPVVLVRVLLADDSSQARVLWKIIDNETRAGTIKFSLDADILNRGSAAQLAALVDDNCLLDSSEFKKRLGRISLQYAGDAAAVGNFKSAIQGCARAIRLAKLAGDTSLLDEAHVLNVNIRERARFLGISDRITAIDSNKGDFPNTGLIQERIWRCIDSLSVADVADRRHAANVLKSLGPYASEALNDLLHTLTNDDDPEVRSLAATAIGQIGKVTREVVHDLVVATNSNEWEIVRSAFDSLRQLGDAVIPHLRQAMSAQDDELRLRAAQVALNLKVESPEALNVIAGFLDTTFGPGIRKKAAASLRSGCISNPNLPDTLVEALTISLRDLDEKVREDCAWALGIIGSNASSAGTTLGDLLSDNAPMVRRAAAIAVGKVGCSSEVVQGHLTRLLEDENEHYYVRIEAAESLAKLFHHSREVEKLLARSLGTTNTSVREAATKAIRYVSCVTEGLVTSLAEMLLKDQDYRVRAAAAETLGTLSQFPNIRVPVLIEALKDEYHVQSAAAIALGNMGSLAEAALPYLEELPVEGSWGIPSSTHVAVLKIRGEPLPASPWDKWRP